MSIQTLPPALWRRGGAIVLAASTAAALALAPDATAASAGAAKIAYAGSAYGSTVALGSLVRSGATASLPLCTTNPHAKKTIHTAALSLPSVGTIGAIDTTAGSNKVGASYSSTTTATTAQSSLLGLISFKTVATTAKAKHTSKGYTLTANTTFVGLRIAGRAAPSNSPAPNTTVPLPGVGTIVLNAQARANSKGTHAVAVKAIKIVLSGSKSGLPAGNITIGYARAALHDPVHTNVSGSSFGTRITVGSGTVKSGPTAPAYLPCGGTSGGLISNSTASVNVPSAVAAGATRSEARSTDTSTRTTAITSSKLANVVLFGGAVKVSTITARVVVTRTATTLTRASTGTLIGGLTINGKSYSGPVKPNTKYSVPGLGMLYLNRQLKTATGMRIYGLELVLVKATNGLPAGADIVVAGTVAAVNPR